MVDLKTYTPSNGSTPPTQTLSQLTTTILNPSAVGCHLEDHGENMGTTVIKNEDVSHTYVLPPFMH